MMILPRYCITFLCLLAISQVHAVEMTLKFVDRNGQPVVGMIAEIHQTELSSVPEKVAIIDQIDRTFVPLVLLAKTGQRVNFPNSDNVRHHVYSFSDIRQFSTPLYADEPIEPILFDRAGIAVLGCNIHDSMVAYVYVSEWEHAFQSNAAVQLRITGVTGAPDTLHLWHPWLQTPDSRQSLDISQLGDGAELTVEVNVLSPNRNVGFRALRQGQN